MSAPLEWHDVNEQQRTYWFMDEHGEFTVVFDDVVRVATNRPSGVHRLETADGMKHIVAPGWLCITIDSEDDWEF